MSESVKETLSHSAEETFALGEKLGERLQAGSVVSLSGELGAGKTVFCKGVCAGLNVHRDEVSSPTFSIVNEYPGRLDVLHFDFYRVTSAEEILNIGWDDYLQREAVVLIEWPEVAEALLPANRISVQLVMPNSGDPDTRTIRVTATDDRYDLTDILGD